MARKTGSHADITGPKVREAALRLIARDGYAAVSMRQIAKDVGLQAGALYRYTPDKQSLLFELMQTHMEELLRSCDALGLGGRPLENLEKFTSHHIRFHLKKTDEVFIAYMELRNLSVENFAVIEGLRATYESRLEDILRDGLRDGVFDVVDTKVATLGIIAMLTGVSTWYRAQGRLALEDIEQIYVQMVRRAVGVT